MSETKTVYMYVLECESYWKIGIAGDVDNRIGQMKIGNPFPITKKFAIRAKDRIEAHEWESQLHSIFNLCRHSGEWFLFTSEEKEILEKAFTSMVTNNQEALMSTSTPLIQALNKRNQSQK